MNGPHLFWRSNNPSPLENMFTGKSIQTLKTDRGKPLPYGITRMSTGHNFALFSRYATTVSLLIYYHRQAEPDHEILLDPNLNRTGDVWHIQVSNLPERFFYLYQVDGPWQPEQGHVFNSEYLLLDPYAEVISGLEHWGKRDSDLPFLMGAYGQVDYDWEDDQSPRIPLKDTIIYEMHARGFSRHASSDVNHPGTYRAIIEKIPYLKQLGVTAVELLPVHEFDETECRYIDPESGEKLLNYWGYSTIGFFALKTGYASVADGFDAINEFRDMVKALHEANLEVILDVVFNHTAEGDRECPILNYKGIANSTYYILDEDGDYRNYSGCGNTMNCNHPVVRKLIMDALRYWVVNMHVDGFRFDLASILTRDETGAVLSNPPLLESIAKDPVLSKVKIIAEAWDAAGLYQVGSFPAFQRWAEWNGQYRDTLRRFLTGEPGLIGDVASRISGSEDLYSQSGRYPGHSVNFITAHDGFTMMDLVSYEKKHNINNGQQNQDGHNQNYSVNFGVEGETDDLTIRRKRKQQVRNMATLLMLSQGTPMILAGDEFGNSQFGNNNAWCQDNEISWLDWRLLSQNSDLFRFWQKLIEFRKAHPSLHRDRFFTGRSIDYNGIPDISWHNTQCHQPGFNSPAQSLAFLIDDSDSNGGEKQAIYVAINFSKGTLQFELPTLPLELSWKQVMSTSDPVGFINGEWLPMPEDQKSIDISSMSIMVLICSVGI